MNILNYFNLAARDKLIIVLVNVVFIASVARGSFIVLALFLALSLLVMAVFRPDYRKLPRRLLTVFLYPFFISIFIPFANQGNIIARFDLGFFTAAVTDTGLATFFTVLIKSFLSLILVTSLVLSTDEKEILHGLRKIRLPAIIVSIIFLMYRYIFLIREEARAGQLSISSRTFGKSYYSANKRLAFLMGNLFIKSFDRAENIYRSMESRGFSGEFYFYEKQEGTPAASIAFLITFIIIPPAIKIIELAGII